MIRSPRQTPPPLQNSLMSSPHSTHQLLKIDFSEYYYPEGIKLTDFDAPANRKKVDDQV